ncbi:MAG: hypothetical protein IJF39_04025 [Clostridia bacterium]|nr:hypothetical protein [Clostridia bacterium]
MLLTIVFGLAAVVAAVGFGLALQRRRERAKAYLVEEMRLQAALPDSRNKYVRSRLETALGGLADQRLPLDARFLHARKLLYALSEKRLSGADSLLLHKLQKEVGRYSTKESVSVYETEEISNALSKLLTLCAKYEV